MDFALSLKWIYLVKWRFQDLFSQKYIRKKFLLSNPWKFHPWLIHYTVGNYWDVVYA